MKWSSSSSISDIKRWLERWLHGKYLDRIDQLNKRVWDHHGQLIAERKRGDYYQGIADQLCNHLGLVPREVMKDIDISVDASALADPIDMHLRIAMPPTTVHIQLPCRVLEGLDVATVYHLSSQYARELAEVHHDRVVAEVTVSLCEQLMQHIDKEVE